MMGDLRMPKPFIIECICGNSIAIDRAKALQKPSGHIVCPHITVERKPCGRWYRASEIINRVERGDDVWIVDDKTSDA
jgi:hypothetical protein